MALVLNPTDINTDNTFKKCGEIITQGYNEFLLVCTFCSEVLLKLDDFIVHIGQQHLTDVYGEVSIKSEISEDNDNITYTSTTKGTKSKRKKKVGGNLRTVAKTRSHWNSTPDQIKVDLLDLHKEEKNEADPLADVEDGQQMELALEKREVPKIEEDSDDLKNPFTDDEFESDFRCSEVEQSETERDTDSDSSKNMKTAKYQNILKEKDDITIAIIAEYKNHPVLWSSDYPPKQNRAKREEAFKHIVNNVNEQFNSDLKWKTVREQITNMFKRYAIELKEQKKAESKGNPFTPSWYFDQLKFLNSEMKYNLQKHKDTRAGSFSPELNDAQNAQFLSIYKRFPCLWDLHNIEYRFQNRRQEALFEMQEAVRAELGLNFTQVQLRNKISLIRDACSHEKKRKIRCEHMEKPFKPFCRYYESMIFLEGNIGPFVCTVCKELFNEYDKYLIHKSSHDGSKAFICPLCDKGYMDTSNFTVHLRHHKSDYEYECEICKKRFATLSNKTLHVQRHTGEKTYFCEICGQSFNSRGFYAHIPRHQNKPTHKCSICAKEFYKRDRLTEHMKTHLDVRNEVCSVCGKAFKTKKNLHQHKLIHAEKKKYSCKICGKDFAQYGGLSGHVKTHGTTLIRSGFNGITSVKRKADTD